MILLVIIVIEILKINHHEGTNYRVTDWTAEKFSKTHMQDHYQYPEKGDIIIDGGNSLFGDTVRRTQYLESKGILFIGKNFTC